MLTPSRLKIYQVSIRPACLLEQDFTIVRVIQREPFPGGDIHESFLCLTAFLKPLLRFATVLMGQLLLTHITTTSISFITKLKSST